MTLYLLQKALRSDLCLTCDLPRPHEEKVQLYRKTFFSLQTGNEWAQSRFLNEENSDETRATIIARNRHLWQSIRPQVREWFKENWPRWIEEKPEWFNQVFISNVDDDLLPPEVLMLQNLMGGGERRRSSIADGVRSRSTAYVAPAP